MTSPVAPSLPPAERLTAGRRLAGQALTIVGRGAAGLPLIRGLGALARCDAFPVDVAAAMVGRAIHARRNRTIEISRRLHDAGHVRLMLDLTYAGCVELLLARHPGDPDRHTGALLLALARDADLVIDVGANVGLYTYLVASATHRPRVIAFEPSPALAGLIARNVVLNGWESRVSVRQEAVGAVRTTLTLHVLHGADTEHTLEPSRAAGRPHDEIRVPVVPLDDVLAAEGMAGRRAVIKIDVEGHERFALDGLERTLRQSGSCPDVLMELLGHAIEREGIIERVLGYGIAAYYIGPHALTRLTRTADLAAVHTLGWWNFLLTPRPAADVAALAERARVPLSL